MELIYYALSSVAPKWANVLIIARVRKSARLAVPAVRVLFVNVTLMMKSLVLTSARKGDEF